MRIKIELDHGPINALDPSATTCEDLDRNGTQSTVILVEGAAERSESGAWITDDVF